MGSQSGNTAKLFPDGGHASGDVPRVTGPVLVETIGKQSAKSTSAETEWVVAAPAPDNTAQAWLTAQCDMIAGTSCGLVINCHSDTGQCQLIASWPHSQADLSQAMLGAAFDAYREQSFVISTDKRGDATDSSSESNKCFIASPLLTGEATSSIAVFELPDAVRSQQQAILQLLQWGVVWYDLLRREHHSHDTQTQTPLTTVVDILARNLEQTDFDSAAIVLVTELASRLSCTRVSLGLVNKQSVSLVAISNTSRVDQRSNLSRDICAAMNEAVDQSSTIASPMINEGLPYVAYAQEVLARRGGKTSVLSTPLFADTAAIGALTLERDDREGFDHDTIKLCEVLAALLGPVIQLKHDKEVPISLKILASMRDFMKRLFGARQIALKLYAILTLVSVVFLTFATADYRITSPARLEGSVMRAVTAPREGFVAAASVRAGDIVEAGDLLATLDNRELQLEQLKLESQREQLNKEYRAAMSSYDRSTTAIVDARHKQTKAQLDLVAEQLARTRLTAPLSGIVVSGDLSQSIGSPVENGQLLFEIAPLDGYRVILEIDERDIGEIVKTQKGTLTLTGLPDETLPFTVNRIVPLSTTRDGRNFFEVQAELDAPLPSIRPGMEGVGKVMVDQRKLVWVWTHELIDWVRLTLWTWTH